MLKDLKKKLGSRWLIFYKLHKIIMSSNPNIEYRIFPIYVSYFIEDTIVLVIYFKGKMTSATQLDIGFALKKKPKTTGFIDASYMNYKGINYSTKINCKNGIPKNIIKTLKTTLNFVN